MPGTLTLHSCNLGRTRCLDGPCDVGGRDEVGHFDEGAWAPFPDALSRGGITWKLLHVSPEAGTWTAIFECPAGSSFNAHFHTGPGEYLLDKGKMEVRGGSENGGDTAIAPGLRLSSFWVAPRPHLLPRGQRILHDVL